MRDARYAREMQRRKEEQQLEFAKQLGRQVFGGQNNTQYIYQQ